MQNRQDNTVNIIDLLFYLLSRWKWFLLSVAVCGGIAWLIYSVQPFVYFSSATVIIKDPSNKTSTAGLDRYDNFINKVNVANEILQFRSKRLLREVITRVHADISYKVDDRLRQRELYTQSPVAVTFPDATSAQYISLTVTPLGGETVRLSIPLDKKNDTTFTASYRDTVSIGNGLHAVVTPTNYYNTSWDGRPVYVTKRPLESMVAYYRSNFGIRQEEDESSILNLSLKDESPVRSREVLNMLVTVYNEEAINDKNQVAINTADFINDRLIIIESELGSVESDLEVFKKDNQVVDISSTAGMYMQESQKYNTDVLELETQLELADYIKEYLTDPAKEVDLIPANTGISDMNIESQISQYNAIKLRRDKLADDSSEMNPVVQELNNSLRAMKQTIIRAVDNMIVSLEVRLSDARSREERAKARMTSIPTKERQMLSIERQQKIKESLYIFLLNRREENALSQAMADNNARVIDEADGSWAPISPNRNKILLLGILVGIAIPGVVFLMILFLDTRVHTRKDIEDVVDIPFLGEIPLDKKIQKQEKDGGIPAAEVKIGDATSEAFRILRTNIAFMMRKSTSSQVLSLTSLNEGAGKTFIALNLALSLAYTKKKVIIVDLDIRKGRMTRHLKKGFFMKYFRKLHSGLTDYLASPDMKPENIINTSGNPDIPDVIMTGTSAPNPTELLMDSRLDELFTYLRSRYDYIIADSVPVGIIADATIVNRVADMTLFVVRAGRIDRRLLPEIERMYTARKLNNIALILNGTDTHRRGYGYGYGYGYGGYGYGYGYGYGTHKKKKFWKRQKQIN